MLEKRVAERTEDLTRLNDALERATAAAEEANISKTRFLAAAGHDILQPLNAARLYATAPVGTDRRLRRGGARRQSRHGARRRGGHLARGARHFAPRRRSLKPDSRPFRLQEVFDRIRVDFAEQARSKGLTLTIIPLQPGGAQRPAALGAAAAEPRLQRHQIYAARTRAGRMPAQARPRRHRGRGYGDRDRAGRADG